ncbi:MAG: DNA repair protein RecN [Thiobacillaceae bacterium]
MLLSLTLVDYILVDRLELALEPGFTVLTGETGAGKSILLDALGLLLGDRADASVIRAGAQRAEVSAEFSLAATPEVSEWLAHNDLDGGAETLLLRRVVEAGGRSRAYINGSPATLQQLREVGQRLVDIHGQHAHYSLLRPEVQRNMLDAYGGCSELAARTAAAWRAWREAQRRRREAEQRATAAAGEREALGWLIETLTQLDFQTEQWQTLQEEHKRLAHAAELLSGAQGVIALLDEEGDGVLARLKTAKNRVHELSGYDPRLAGSAQMLEEGWIQVQEAVRELSRYAERVELDPDALAAIEARIAQVMGVARRLRCTPEELPQQLEEARQRLAALAAEADPETLARAEAAAASAYQAAARALSACRQTVAAPLSEAVTAAMQRLAMAGGRLEVALNPSGPESGGLETVEFRVAPHPAQELRPLAKTASGGELSRIGLALQTVLAGRSGAPTLIFDEVDAGIGGGVAEVVGRLLAEVARDRQVLCVTHLPQVAARADHHWRVSKTTEGGAARSRIEVLSPAARVDEIARMLGGVKLTELTRRHAREMLQQTE